MGTTAITKALTHRICLKAQLSLYSVDVSASPNGGETQTFVPVVIPPFERLTREHIVQRRPCIVHSSRRFGPAPGINPVDAS